MQKIELYTYEDAIKEVVRVVGRDRYGISGAAASVKKWESICKGLKDIRNEMGRYCGLCIEHRAQGDWCLKCPLWYGNQEKGSSLICCHELHKAARDLDEAVKSSNAMLRLIRTKTFELPDPGDLFEEDSSDRVSS